MCDSDGPAWVAGGDGASALQVTGLNQASIWAEVLSLQGGSGWAWRGLAALLTPTLALCLDYVPSSLSR